LSGVGFGPTVEHESPEGLVWHFRRGLNDDEVGMLSTEWLAIPARDGFTVGGPIEAKL
jgi:hypothetical protein